MLKLPGFFAPGVEVILAFFLQWNLAVTKGVTTLGDV